MDHVAIMRTSWGLTDKILNKQKKIESRWYTTKHKPWDIIKDGDSVYFKDSGGSVRIKAQVKQVMQFSGLTPKKLKWILDKYGKEDGIEKEKIPEFLELFKHKNYCILIFLKNPAEIKPFEIDKKGYGTMSAWITVEDINHIRIKA